MGNITVLKRPGIMGDEIVKIIEGNINHHTLLVVNEHDHDILLTEGNIPELLIIDTDFCPNCLKMIDFFLEKKSKIITYVQNTTNSLPLLIKLFDKGLHGYFDFEMEVNEIIKAIERVLKGNHYIHPNLSNVLLDEYIRIKGHKVEKPEGMLTEREWEVLELIVQGKENEQIGEQLFISPTTVTNHVSSILRKLNVENRTKATSIALKNRWITL